MYKVLYEQELPDDVIEVVISYNEHKFSWCRQDSNKNVERYGFSHYLSSKLYRNDRIVYDGEIIDDTGIGVTIKTEDKKSGIAHGYVIGHDRKGKSYVVVFVSQIERVDDKIRITSCSPTKDKNIIRTFFRKVPSFKRNTSVEWRWSQDYIKKNEKHFERCERVFQKIVKRNVRYSLKARKTFLKKIKAKSLDW